MVDLGVELGFVFPNPFPILPLWTRAVSASLAWSWATLLSLDDEMVTGQFQGHCPHAFPFALQRALNVFFFFSNDSTHPSEPSQQGLRMWYINVTPCTGPKMIDILRGLVYTCLEPTEQTKHLFNQLMTQQLLQQSLFSYCGVSVSLSLFLCVFCL